MAFNAPSCVRTHAFFSCLASLSLFAVLTLQVSCSGGGGVTLDPPNASTVQAITYGTDSVRLAAPAGSADPGTAVTVTAGATGSDTVAADGSFSFDAVLTAGASQVTVAYAHGGFDLTTTSNTGTLADRVTKPLFSTGAGPNDMVYGHNSLFIANSLDNTVVRYGLDGTVLATASFDAGASPSYLGLKGIFLWITCNGDNRIVALDADSLAPLAGAAFQLDSTGLAFMGPSQPVMVGSEVFIPRNEIASFAPTVYAPGRVSVLDAGIGPLRTLVTTGLNPQYLAVDYRGTSTGIYLTCSGDIQFDEHWEPYAASDSYFEQIGYDSDDFTPRALSLGPIGAGRIALSPPTSHIALIGSSLAANLYVVDLDTFTAVRGADNPIVLTAEYSFSSDLTFTPDGKYALALSFNTDELYVLDAESWALNPGAYPEPFDLSLGADLLAGTANVEVAPDPARNGKYAAYVLYGVGNAVAKVELF